MPDITQQDVMLLLTMGLAVVSMSFVFPALGLADESVDANEIPEFTVDTARFDFAGDFPEAPGNPASGDLSYIEGRDEQLNQVWLRGDISSGEEMALIPPAGGNPTQIVITEWDSQSIQNTHRLNFTQEGQTSIFVNETVGYRIQFEALTLDDDAGEWEVRYEVLAQDTDSGWLSNVPILGGAVQLASGTAAVLGWFAEIIVWAFAFLFDLIANAVGLGGDVATYLITLIAWLTTTYTGIVASADAWVAVFVALPGILLSAVLAKFVIVGASLLPTT